MFDIFSLQVRNGSGETVIAQLVKQTKANYAECIGQENSFTVRCEYMSYIMRKPVFWGHNQERQTSLHSYKS